MPATLQRLPSIKASSRKEHRTLIDELLAEQATLQTPVARFSEIHDRAPDLADHYRSLIPLTKPGAGEQYAFEVSLDRCTGCKACVSACHSLNGLDDNEVWRDTGVLLGGNKAPGWQQTITTACHHCEDPGCLNGCPVGAYEKDQDTGIVRHLDDQCIGCSYCILKCPYDVPKYSKKRGIVRKCDMCHQRLAEGEAPACVQACPTEAIRIVNVRSQGAGVRDQKINFFSSTIHDLQSEIPDSSITHPTTRYVGRDVPATAYAADRAALVPQHAHWPLILMLVLTQSGVGILPASSSSSLTLTAAILFYLGMAASIFHLGQPLKAWRFFLGLKTSWLSREILAFSLFAPIPFSLCALPFLPGLSSQIPLLTDHRSLGTARRASRRLHQRDDLSRHPPRALEFPAHGHPLLRHRRRLCRHQSSAISRRHHSRQTFSRTPLPPPREGNDLVVRPTQCPPSTRPAAPSSCCPHRSRACSHRCFPPSPLCRASSSVSRGNPRTPALLPIRPSPEDARKLRPGTRPLKSIHMLSRLLKQHSGPLTRELVQSPGDFGLGKLPSRLKPVSTATSICGYCATGCQLKIHLDAQGNAINLSPEHDYPVNLGMACPKGWQALDPLDSPDRATTPLLRDESGGLKPVDWTTALDAFVSRFKSIQKMHGSESAAFLSTGQIPFEEMAYLGCLWKFGMGFLHGDANTRQCMATAATAYKQSFGFDAPPGAYADFEESDVIVLVGANLCIAHPILWQRVMRNRRDPQIIVIDPRATETAQAATQHIALKPKGDLALFYSLAHCIIRDDRIDPHCIANTQGYEAFAEFVQDYPPESVMERTGQSLETIEVLARAVSEPGKRVSWWWTMGINQSYEGVRAAQAMINLALITGNIGKPGTGANSITGQCNAMGSRLFSNTTSLVGGHDFADDAHREKVAGILGIPVENIPRDPTLAYDQIFDAVDDGKIKALWIVATNPFHSWVNNGRLARLREKLDFLVVQDMYHTTESAGVADLILPAAGWGEKTGCFINSERRIGTVKAVRRAPGTALSDFRIFRLISRAWGCGEMFEKWTDPESVFKLLRDLTKDRPCDITGISDYAHLDEQGGIQWPWPSSLDSKHTIQNTKFSECRLFENGRFYTPDGKARFHFSPPAELAEPPDQEFPFTLLTGRGTSSQWHTLSRTGKSDILKKLCPSAAYVEIHPEDAARLGLQVHDRAVIRSRRGTITAEVYPAPTVQMGQIFIPMHFPEVNRITHASFDPHSRQPSYKASAVSVRKR